MQVVTLSSKFQICIPKQIREQLHLESGQQFILIAENNGLHLVPKRNIKDMKGILAGANKENVRDREDRY